MQFYTFPASANCRKVAAVAKELGLELEEKVVDFMAGGHKAPDYLAINPNGKVPALVDGDVKLWESNAIMGYLCSKVDNTDLWPKSNARYDIMRWMYWELAHWGPPCDTFAFENVLKGMIGAGDPDAAKLATATEDFKKYAGILENHLEGRKYLTGDKPTIADIAVASHLTYAVPAKIPVGEFKRVSAWNTALNELPGWRDTAPKMG